MPEACAVNPPPGMAAPVQKGGGEAVRDGVAVLDGVVGADGV